MYIDFWCFIFLFYFVCAKSEDVEVEEVHVDDNLKSTSRIVGGYAALTAQFPYQVLVRSFNTANTVSICGGSILSPRFVLTAAHCAKAYKYFEIGFGSTSYSSPLYRVKTSEVIIHEKFDSKLLSNDIAIIKLPVNILFGRTVATIHLPTREHINKNFLGLKATVSGFGRVSDHASQVSHVLNFVEMRVIAMRECSSIFGTKIVTKNVICAKGYYDIHNNACLGDSGGPMVIEENGKAIQIGIVSFVSSRGCSHGDPSGYTNVVNYLDWIAKHTGIGQHYKVDSEDQ